MWPSQHKDAIISDLVCAICNELFVEPLSFLCGHSFCRECITRWANQKRCHQLRNTSATFPCPLCKEDLPVMPSALEKTHVNIALRNLADDLKQSLCALEYCKRHPREEAKFVCMTCLMVFCGTCSAIERLHNDRDHDVSTKKNVRQEIKLMFSEHKRDIEKAAEEMRTLFQFVQSALEELMDLEQGITGQLKVDAGLFQEQIKNKRKDYISFLDNHVRVLKAEWDSFALRVTRSSEEVSLSKAVVFLRWLRQSEPEIKRLNEERAKVRRQWDALKMQGPSSIVNGVGQSELSRIIGPTVNSGAKIHKVDTRNLMTEAIERLLVAECPKVAAKRMSHFVNASHYYLKDANLFNNSILVVNHHQNALQRINIFDGRIFTLNDDLGESSLRRHICGKMETMELDIAVSLESTAIIENTTISTTDSTTNGNSADQLAVLKLTWNPFSAFGGAFKTCHSFPGFHCKKLRRARNDVFAVSSQGELLQVHTFGISSPPARWQRYRLTCVEDMVVFESDKRATLFVKRGLRTIAFCDYPGQLCDWIQCDISFFNEVSFMAPDSEGNLWILDTTQGNLLACLTPGCLHIKRRLEVVGEVHGVFNFCNDLLVLTRNGPSEGILYTIPFSDMR